MSIAEIEKTASWPHWTTPAPFLERVRRVGPIGLDPCPNDASIVFPRLVAGNGLVEGWTGHGLVFVNPPYSRGEVDRWTEKCAREARLGAEIIALLPASMDTEWSHRNVLDRAQGAIVWRGRIKFGNPPPGIRAGTPRFTSLVAYFGPQIDRFFWTFDGCGKPWRLAP